MKLSALLKGVGAEVPSQDVEIENITDKLSDVKENTLFVCIDGENCDGNELVPKALSKGAVAVISERKTAAEISVRVSNSRNALSVISANFYGNPSKKIKLIGITGTNGKTTTAFLVRHILENSGKSCGLVSTVELFNGKESFPAVLTTPEPPTLQKLFFEMAENGCEYCVCEVSSQALSQNRTDGVNFCVSAITNITPEHLNYHLNMENYISAKLRLFEQSNAAVLNIDDENIHNNIDKIGCRKISVSLKSADASYFAKNISSNFDGVEFLLSGHPVRMKLCGTYNVYNALTAAAICSHLGVDIKQIINALETFSGASGRFEKIPVNRDFTVIIDYAHTPDGFQNVIYAAREFTKNRVITVFGCGGDRDKSKRPVMGKIAGELSDTVIITDDNPRTESSLRIIGDITEGIAKTKCHYAVIPDRRDAIEFALKIAEKGDTVLFLGKGHEKYQITANGKVPFDEKEIIYDFLKQE